jgi:hypothetical protein
VKPYNFDEYEVSRLQRMIQRLPTGFDWWRYATFRPVKIGVWESYSWR